MAFGLETNMQNWRTQQTITVTIPLLIALVTILALYLLPAPARFDTFLSAHLQNQWLECAVKFLCFFLLFAFPYVLYQRAHRPSLKVQLQFMADTREAALARHELRLNDLADEIDAIVAKFAARGFPLPPGMMAGEVFELLRKELKLFNEILEDTINRHSLGKVREIYKEKLKELRVELLQDRALLMKRKYSVFFDTYFRWMKDEMETNKNFFYKTIDSDCELLIKSQP